MFYGLSGVLPKEEAMALLKHSIEEQYSHKGPKVIGKNIEAVDTAMERLQKIDVPAAWLTAASGGTKPSGGVVSNT